MYAFPFVGRGERGVWRRRRRRRRLEGDGGEERGSVGDVDNGGLLVRETTVRVLQRKDIP